MNIKEIKEKLTALNYELNTRKKIVEKNKLKLVQSKKHLNILNDCYIFLIELNKKAQEEVINYIEDMVTLACQSVFGEEDYQGIKINLIEKRDQMELVFKIIHKNIELDITSDSVGGGVIDVYAFALRIVMWSLENPKAPPILIMDEPFKFVSKEYQPAVAKMLKNLASLMELQIIMNTHNSDIKNSGENIIHI